MSEETTSEKACYLPRFLVRQGYKGWMVYDRERKGPAMVGTNPAVDLTKERADKIERTLTAECAQKRGSSQYRVDSPPNGPAPTDLGKAARPPDRGLGAKVRGTYSDYSRAAPESEHAEGLPKIDKPLW
jgi:hypothetical protein